MALEKAQALVIKTTDWSETSRIATLWTREFGKVRALAKGGRRLKSSFESALDLLTVCSIVLIRKTSGSLDLLTEAQVQERFGQLRHDLQALYAAYHVAELLNDWTEDHDPHAPLFDEALATLRTVGQAGVATGPRLARFELVFLRELGYGPALEVCAACTKALAPRQVAFSSAAGGALCPACQPMHKDRRTLTTAAWNAMRAMRQTEEAWRDLVEPSVRHEVRQVLSDYESYVRGKRPRLAPYLGS